MNGFVKSLFKGLMIVTFEYLLCMPVILLMGITLFDHLSLGVWMAVVPLLYYSVYVIRMIVRNIRIYWVLLPGIVLLAVIVYISADTLRNILPAILLVPVLYRGIALADSDWDSIFPKSMFFFGMLEYFVLYFFFTRLERLMPYVDIVGVCGIVTIILVLFIVNSETINRASLDNDNDSRIPKVVVRNNRILTFVALAAVFLITAYKFIYTWIIDGIRAVVGLVFRLFSWLFKDIHRSYEMEPLPTDQPPDFMLPVEESDPSPIMDKLIEIIGMVMFAAAAVVLAIIIIRLVIKLIGMIIGLIKKVFTDRSGSIYHTGYSDQRENLLDWNKMRREYQQSIRNWVSDLLKREPKWESLGNNHERARFLYRRFILRSIKAGYNFKNYLTPRETVNEIFQTGNSSDMGKNLYELYNKARYGNCRISDNEVDVLKKHILGEENK